MRHRVLDRSGIHVSEIGYLLLAATMLAAFAGSLGAQPQSLALLLEGALLRPGGDVRSRCDIRVDAVVRDGRFEPAVWAYAPLYNRADHKGSLAVEGQEPLKMRIQLDVRGDIWVGGGEAAYSVVLTRNGEQYDGTYTGTYRGRPIEGKARGTLSPLWPSAVEGHKPLAPGEHPRLLFRKDEVAGLRERVKSGAGAEMVERLRSFFVNEDKGFGYGRGQAGSYGMGYHAAGHAMLYALEGKQEEAAKAKAFAIQAMKGNVAQDEIFYCGYAIGVALAYDMCYDSWDEPFRRAVAAWLERFAWDLTHNVRDWRPQNMSAGIQDMNAYGTELTMNRAAAGMAALAILGDPSEFPGEVPADKSAYSDAQTSPNDTDAPHDQRYKPFDGLVLKDPGFYPRPTAIQVQADEALAAAKGLPVMPYEHDRMITRWLTASLDEDPAWRPFAPAGPDPLQGLGGSSKARPIVGTKVTYRDKTAEFAPIDPADVYHDNWTDNREAINLLHKANLEKQTLDYYYTVIENDAPRFARMVLGNRYLWWPNMWLGGQGVKEDQVVLLPKGRIPLLIQARVPIQQTYAPHFPAFYGNSKYKHRALGGLLRNNWFYNYATLEDTPVATIPLHPMWFQPRLVDAADPKVEWTKARDAWAANGKVTPTAADALQIAVRTVQRYARSGLGEHGWWNGNNGYDETFEMAFPFMHACQTALGQDLAKDTPLEWAIINAIIADGFGLKTTDTGDWRYTFPAGLKTLRREHVPLVRHIIETGIRPYSIANPLIACVALAAYPYDTKAVDPQGVLPLTWVDQTNGGYVFRNNYDPKQKLVCVVERGVNPIPTAGQAGGFSISGGAGPGYAVSFGKQFGDSIGGGGVWRNSHYGDANVVIVDGTLPAGGAKQIAYESKADGSGVVSMDTSLAYLGAEPELFENPAAQGWGVRWGNKKPTDIGIRSQRSLAIDYSGACGSPALLAVVDRFSGDEGRAKTWQLHISDREVGMQFMVRPVQWDKLARRFTVYSHWVSAKDPAAQANPKLARPDDWLMEGTVAAPADAQFAYDGGVLKLTSKADAFFVVMTVKRGGESAAPAVQGEKLDAKVTVGEQVIRFDGKRVVLGK